MIMKIFSIMYMATLVGAKEVDESFDFWAKHHNKKYPSESEYNYRKMVFENNYSQNKKLSSSNEHAFFDMNMFSDLTDTEFNTLYKGYVKNAQNPDTFDWRNTSPFPVTPVKNQGMCGSCWAFSATEGIEAAWIMAGNKKQILSPQEIVSCDSASYGCQGGDLTTAFDFVQSTPLGLDTNTTYPYTSGVSGVTGECNSKLEKNGVVKIVGSQFAVEPCATSDVNPDCSQQNLEEVKLESQLIKHGPISICVNAGPWQMYSGGVLTDESNCPGGLDYLDHCVQLVGYNKKTKPNYWIVRNSWGEDWGENGYIYLEMGKNMCGVADEAMFVEVETIE